MIQITPQVGILVAIEAVDGRKGIDSLARLRCNLCGEIFEAEAPAGVGEEKCDESA